MSADLKVLPSRKREVQQSVIDLLETALEKAREGELVEVALAAVVEDAEGHGSWTSYSEGNHGQAMLGAIRIVEHKLIRHILDQ